MKGRRNLSDVQRNHLTHRSHKLFETYNKPPKAGIKTVCLQIEFFCAFFWSHIYFLVIKIAFSIETQKYGRVVQNHPSVQDVRFWPTPARP